MAMKTDEDDPTNSIQYSILEWVMVLVSLGHDAWVSVILGHFAGCGLSVHMIEVLTSVPSLISGIPH